MFLLLPSPRKLLLVSRAPLETAATQAMWLLTFGASGGVIRERKHGGHVSGYGDQDGGVKISVSWARRRCDTYLSA